MGVRPIVDVGDPVLRQVAEQVDPADLGTGRTQALVDDLIDTMRSANGAGLAANQIGVPLSLAVIEVSDNPRYPYKPPIDLTVIVNPVIEPIGDEMFEVNEGCLSVPDLRGNLHRHVNIRVSYLDREGANQIDVRRGLTAGTFQHEVDHLNGGLFLDRVHDSTTFATWEQFDRFQREAFVRRITAFVHEVGS